MKNSLTEGFQAEKSWSVTDDMSPPHLAAKVLSTPSMVQCIEQTCLQAIAPHLDEGETSVGTHINGLALGARELGRAGHREGQARQDRAASSDVRGPGPLATGHH